MFSRPWGTYEIIARGEGFLTKKIVVHPQQRLSLQSHEHRSEHWVIIDGEGAIMLGTDVIRCSYNTSVFVPRGVKHRIHNTSKNVPLVFIEVQVGQILEETDIIRYEDDYDRKTESFK
mgnify:CR=1 FL=1